MESNVSLSFLLLAAALSHDPWTAILQRHVTPQARVDYAALSRQSLPALDAYIATLAQPWPASLTPAETKAAMINAYNALTVRWVASHYPIPSIWRTRHPFTEVRHTVNGRRYSLDQIETELRDLGDPRVHSVLVCAARSCPPLRSEAYLAEKLDAQLDDNTRRWLAVPSLNTVDPATGAAEVSQIFEWYRGDFEKDGASLTAFLSKYAPHPVKSVRFREYYWGLNDSGSAGDSYSKPAFYFDYFRNKYL